MKHLKSYESFKYQNVNNIENIDESFGTILTSILLVANSLLGGKPVDDKVSKNDKIKDQVENVLKDETKKQAVVDTLYKMGHEDAASLIEDNAQKVLNALDNKDVSIKKKQGVHLGEIYSYLEGGYALTKIQVDTVHNLFKSNETVITYDTLSSEVDDRAMFDQGTFNLSQQYKIEMDSIFNTIRNANGVIFGIRIESSTDKERISDHLGKVLKSKGHDASNKGLSEIRNDIVKDYLSSKVDTNIIQQIIKHDEGKITAYDKSGKPDLSKPQDASARYVTVHIDYKILDQKEVEMVKDKGIEYVFNIVLVKVKEVSNHPSHHKFDIDKFKINKKLKTKKSRVKVASCPNF